MIRMLAARRKRRTNLSNLVRNHGTRGWACHIDLHETTDTDESEFQPARPRGTVMFMRRAPSRTAFTLCGDEKNPSLGVPTSVDKSVSEVTHIAPADPGGTIIGS